MSCISVVCSSNEHPVWPLLTAWCDRNRARLVTSVSEVTVGDFLFLVSCGEIVPPAVRSRFRYSLVLHAADLPKGRGWSPHVWAILAGADELTVSLLAADHPVDSGAIWQQIRLPLDGTELFDEVNDRLFAAELELMDWALANCDTASPAPQIGMGTVCARRTPADSEVTPDQTLAEVFDLLRVADPTRFPAFFDHRGARYAIRLERVASAGVGRQEPDQSRFIGYISDMQMVR